MSFRGGRGGGRFGGRGGGGGAPMTEDERNARDHSFPTPTYPHMEAPLQSKPTKMERQSAMNYVQFRSQVREGPFYVGNYTIPPEKRKLGSLPLVTIQLEESNVVNDGIKRYTDRYHHKRPSIVNKRAIDEHPYVAEFFPVELHEVMGISTDKKSKSRRLDIAKFKAGLLLTEDFDENEDPEAREKRIKAKLEQMDSKDLDEKSEDEEEFDDEFEEEDDDDYNAEKYFDDGDGMDDDDGDDEAAY